MNAVLLLASPFGLLLAWVMPFLEGQFGPVQLAAYMKVYVLMLLPNLVLLGACTVDRAEGTERE